MLRAAGCEAEELLRRSHDSNILRLIDLLKNSPQDLLQSEQTRLSEVRHLIVDECQDLTGVRAELVRTLLSVLCPSNDPTRGFTLLGDPHQSIYDWTMGTGPRAGITSMELVSWIKKEYAGELVLPVMAVNYRTTSDTLDLLDKARSILYDMQAPDARLAALQNLIASTVPELAEQDVVRELGSGGTTGLLCRTNGDALLLSGRISAGIPGESRPGVHAGTRPADIPSWIGVALSRFEAPSITRSNYLRLINLNRDAKVGRPPLAEQQWHMLARACGLPETATSFDMALLRERLQWPDALPDDEVPDTDGAIITTTHQSKGKEYDRVLLTATDSNAPLDEGACTEAARLLYVGMTRTRSRLYRLPETPAKLYQKPFNDDRKRWTRFDNNTTYLEAGICGDIEEISFVSRRIFPTVEAVYGSQDFLRINTAMLSGKPIRLDFKYDETTKKVRYLICVVLPDREVVVGRMDDQFTRDLLKLKHAKQGFPKEIEGLRVGSVVTMALRGEPDVEVYMPWSTSGLWLGIRCHGLCSMKFAWRIK